MTNQYIYTAQPTNHLHLRTPEVIRVSPGGVETEGWVYVPLITHSCVVCCCCYCCSQRNQSCGSIRDEVHLKLYIEPMTNCDDATNPLRRDCTRTGITRFHWHAGPQRRPSLHQPPTTVSVRQPFRDRQTDRQTDGKDATEPNEPRTENERKENPFARWTTQPNREICRGELPRFYFAELSFSICMHGAMLMQLHAVAFAMESYITMFTTEPGDITKYTP